ncbi:hypothetical protein DL769_010808 [Monosporascus sp. CRB-8-3]|nr:hypothetical protein DL769_010808 [Monosporascus sp. CRB-8-3]
MLSRGHITKITRHLLHGLIFSSAVTRHLDHVPHGCHKFSIRERDNLDAGRDTAGNNLYYAGGNDNCGDIQFYWHCCHVRTPHPFNGQQKLEVLRSAPERMAAMFAAS